jgi:hypothetical protein
VTEGKFTNHSSVATKSPANALGSPLIRIKSTPDTPLSHIFREPQSPIAGPACPGLSSLSSLSSHISTGEPKREEDLKEEAALPIPPKGQKRSNFIEFYKNRRHSENLGTCHPNRRSLQFVPIFSVSSLRDLSSRFVLRRDWNFAEVKFGGQRAPG